MTIINSSYAVLKDVELRREHDAWLAQMELADSGTLVPEASAEPERPDVKARSELARRIRDYVAGLSRRERVLVALCGLLCGLALLGGKVVPESHSRRADNRLLEACAASAGLKSASESSLATESPDRASAQAVTSEAAVPQRDALDLNSHAPMATRPPLALHAIPWQTAAGYLSGTWIGENAGPSSATIDNTANRADVIAVLLATGGARNMSVRQVFIPAGQSFHITAVRPGRYKVRVTELDTGNVWQSAAFELVGHQQSGTRAYRDIRVRLRPARNNSISPLQAAENMP